jgi:four helix bundle protein
LEFILEKLEVYNITEKFSDDIWKIVIKWVYFKKNTIGKQLVRAADSISANIAEGYGRYYYKDSKQFYFYSRGSIQETKLWLSKCLRRKIIELEICGSLIETCKKILLMQHAFIKFVANSQKNKLSANHTNKPIN